MGIESTPSRLTDFSIEAIMGNNIGNNSMSTATTATSSIKSDIEDTEDMTFNAKQTGSSTATNSTTKKPRPKKYQCPYCWVALSNTGQFRGHIRIHTGERPFRCDFPNCEKTFTRNEELTRHKRIHTGQRPFACDICVKRFGRKDHLKKHSRTHERHSQISVASPSPSISNTSTSTKISSSISPDNNQSAQFTQDQLNFMYAIGFGFAAASS